MFPRSFLFFIFIIVIDLILKSLKDKQKIERAKAKRREQLSRQPGNMETTVIPIERKRETISKSNIKEDLPMEKTIPIKEEICRTTIYEQEHKSFMEKKVKDDSKTDKPKTQIKNDILRGIIYSEILSEPRSLKNMRKSI